MPRKSAMPGKSALLLKTPRTRALAVAVLVAAAAVIVIARRQPSQPEMPAPEVQPTAVTAAKPTERPRATKAATSTTGRANRAPAAMSTEKTTVTAPGANMSESVKPSAVAPVSATTGAKSTAAASAQKSTAVTITGCLERDDDKFRLKDTDGEDAPRSRSWKAGFLKRSNRKVDVIDVSNRFKLSDHVGERVSATGTLVDGDMQLRSLSRVATSCKEKA